MARISLTIPDDFKIEVDEYAAARGFLNASNLARVALYYYLRKNKPATSQASRESLHGASQEGQAERTGEDEGLKAGTAGKTQELVEDNPRS